MLSGEMFECPIDATFSIVRGEKIVAMIERALARFIFVVGADRVRQSRKAKVLQVVRRHLEVLRYFHKFRNC